MNEFYLLFAFFFSSYTLANAYFVSRLHRLGWRELVGAVFFYSMLLIIPLVVYVLRGSGIVSMEQGEIMLLNIMFGEALLVFGAIGFKLALNEKEQGEKSG